MNNWDEMINENKEILQDLKSDKYFFSGIIFGIIIGLCGNLIVSVLYEEIISKLSLSWKIIILFAACLILLFIGYISFLFIKGNKKDQKAFITTIKNYERWRNEDQK